jgi:xanthine dehydrogenase accessory factor
MNYETFLSDYERARTELGEFVVVTLTSFQGSAPQILGARMIASKLGYFSGTVGGGKLEKAAIEKCVQILSSDQKSAAEACSWNLQRDLGMSCGGSVTLLFEYQSMKPNWKIAIFGAGHVSQELTRVLGRLNCQIDVFDTRFEWIEKLPKDVRYLIPHLVTSLESEATSLPENTYVVVATMGHSTDLPVLKALFNGRKFPYVGAIGSEVKAVKLRAGLLELGVSQADCDALHCPIGEDIGDNTPAEIAISIAAQLLRKRGT